MCIRIINKATILFIILGLTSCVGHDMTDDLLLDQQIQDLNKASVSENNVSSTKTVYVTGYISYNDGASGAFVWRNGICSLLINGGIIKASCIAFDDDTLYLVDVYQYFKNGIRIPLGTNSTGAYSSKNTTDIKISNHDVYISGRDNGAVYWKNGVINALNGGTEATGIFVTSSNDVYVSGKNTIWSSWKDIVIYARYWKNGQMFNLGVGDAVDIAVKDTDTYVLGHQDNKAVLWKNGIKTILSETSYFIANHIEISGNDIIISGKVIIGNKEYATYWKNGVMNQLNSNGYSSQTTSIYIDPDNNDLYISGNIGDGTFQNAVYWKNGIVTILPANMAFGFGSKRYSSTDIIVK